MEPDDAESRTAALGRGKRKQPSDSYEALRARDKVRKTRASQNDIKALRFEDIEPKSLQQHVSKMSKHLPGQAPQEILNRISESKAEFHSQARKFLSKWYDTRGDSFDARELTLDTISAVLSQTNKFRRQMTSVYITDTRLREVAQAISKEHTTLSWCQVVLKIAKEHDELHSRARQCLNKYLNKNYLPRGGGGPALDPASSRDVGIARDAATERDDAKVLTTTIRVNDPVGDDVEGESAFAEDEMSDGEISSGASGESESNGGVPVEDEPYENRDYGEIARDAATNVKNHSSSNTPGVRLYELSEADQALQKRYFLITDPVAYVHCLSCGEKGHMEMECPLRTCSHCGAVDEHFATACPTFHKCGRCRQRGHTSPRCKNFSAITRGIDDPCDVCGRIGHIEEQCAAIGRTSIPKLTEVVKVPEHEMRKGCYNCGSRVHFGDDCPRLPNFIREQQGYHGLWSMNNAKQFIEVEDTGNSDGMVENGGVQRHQLALLDDTRD